jgi:hypothetical protein
MPHNAVSMSENKRKHGTTMAGNTEIIREVQKNVRGTQRNLT